MWLASHPAMRRIAKLYVPIALGLIIDMLGVALSYNLASRTGEQSIPWMQYSATLIQFPLGLVSIAISIAILPTLSRQASDGQPEAFTGTLVQGLKLVLVLTIPATVGLWVLARPIVALVFEHGDFTAADTLGTVGALRLHLVGLIFAAIDQPLIFAFYARKDTWTPALVGIAMVVLYVVMALAPTAVVDLTLSGLILANSMKWAGHALTMLFLLQRRTQGIRGHGMGQLIAKAMLASVVMGGTAFLVMTWLAAVVPPGFLGEVLLVGVTGGVGTALYGLLATAMGIEELHLVRRAFRDLGQRLTLSRR
jgi:putative peptidoglycan lipid II flippase